MLPNVSKNLNTENRYYGSIFCSTIAYGTIYTTFVHYKIYILSSVLAIFILFNYFCLFKI